jgi:hypothetical protein
MLDCHIRMAWRMRFNLSERQVRSYLTVEGMWQLSKCRSDEARRLLLGISR